jgi:hypothetical protein
MSVLLGYFAVAVGAGVVASGIIGYILANMLIGRYEKADRHVKILSTSATTIQPISYQPTALPVPSMQRGLLHRLKYLSRSVRPPR